MDRRRLLMIVVFFAGAGCGERQEKYVSEEGRFRIYLPGVPSTDPDPDLPTGVKKVGLIQRSGSYCVAWEDLPDKPKDIQSYLDDASQRAVDALKGKERSRKRIDFGGQHPGRELLLVWPDGAGLVHHRMYVVGKRLYHVSVSGPPWWVETAMARKVLDSFELMEE